MTYQEIQKANELIKTIDIKGKEYAEVPQRINAFRSICPNGEISTVLLSLENGQCVIQATIKDENGRVLGTGLAYEKEGSTFINKTSYIENCETSAVGRALGMCGFGVTTSVASAEEVLNAIKQQNKNIIPKPNSSTGDFTPRCSVCKKEITIAEHDFSISKYKKILCRGCQQNERNNK